MTLSSEEERVLQQQLVNNLLNDPRPNAWEKEFLVSINSQLVSKELSEKQTNILNRIKAKCRIPVK